MADRKVVTFWAEPERIEAYKDAASADRKSLSGWLRDLADDAAGRPEAQPIRRPTVIKAQTIAKQLQERASKSATAQPASGDCDNRVPKGTFCKRCGRTH